MFRFFSAGESHGKGLTVIVDGFPSGVPVSEEFVQKEMARRMAGFGRGGRMIIEKDSADFTSGVRKGISLGTPISVLIRNRDFKNWKKLMSPFGSSVAEGDKVKNPRPGHADLSGVLKRGRDDVRDILERASARETASRVAAGALAKTLLFQFGIYLLSRVVSVGKVVDRGSPGKKGFPFESVDGDPLRMFNPVTSEAGRILISEAEKEGDTVGGKFEVIAIGVPPGIGDYSQWDKRLDGKAAKALMSIPAIKAVEIGEGVLSARRSGKKVHDRIYSGKGNEFYKGKYRLPFFRKSNSAGGIEGGMSNGEPIVLRCYMKPIPSLTVPLETVSIDDYSPVTAVRERSDVCAVPAASIVGEAMLSIVLVGSLIEKFGGDCLEDMKGSYERYLERICLRI